MARSSADEIRRRIAKRKKGKGTADKTQDQHLLWPGNDDESYGYNYISPSGGGDDGHPLFKKEVLFFKVLASILLFLVVAIMFRSQVPAVEPVKNFVVKTMDKEFKFATVSKWYEDKFGKPLALLPFTEKNEAGKTEEVQSGAVPVTGRLLENFEKNGQGIMIETGKGAPVQVINDGFVSFAAVKEGLGKTVIVQHGDGSETWYGNLESIKVKLYEYIDKRTVVGTVSGSASEDKTKGQYYFAVKKDESFIDPVKVIRFE
ncbi:M23 family metallopeptidase [Neobacillus kokaensis]|uniref:Stage IV sporulation protein FA n=1 Tax=Neobacillus kokaensis TaxID=2759023 RepID=A0ABQ3MZE2_9BACI|nr:M23 family metallopeptidase [Neobacillus kokaensis]GHH97174.1 stage IV sporulation protein FA [Neobacillus kokaensis]